MAGASADAEVTSLWQASGGPFNQKQEIPRLCRGDSRCLTYSGVHRRTDVVSRQAHDEGDTDGRRIEPKAAGGSANIT